MVYSIGDIETAINIWRNRIESGSDAALCAPARALAEPYALMVYGGRDTISDDQMGPEARSALSVLNT
ncbi:DUF3717 domain-containing protein [Burkholderia multivorans]|uniref:DUF3717 domain-containing protein n=1 Tax=Burkholderia multivorans TaxID=87883 RepID=UPI000770CA11|nr:DUF3717 domain-containing protein [Burkholderia multivorans]KVS16153.1 hypothetical protein WK33_06365 [Burkholderia multivorans]MBU9651075.1 DUF3717 domain-containing protein [Burkholderia multivorans]MCO1451081.1 DUF3717 domain-containing protein [Burkholderia multivorans]MDN8103987.1 DUF3717 domain-containing protein [Burkholderia multivorans]PRG70405.1 DUF3717 domain-containing protein [Burkholderia multivorans]